VQAEPGGAWPGGRRLRGRGPRRVLAALVALALGATACGLSPGAARDLGQELAAGSGVAGRAGLGVSSGLGAAASGLGASGSGSGSGALGSATGALGSASGALGSGSGTFGSSSAGAGVAGAPGSAGGGLGSGGQGVAAGTGGTGGAGSTSGAQPSYERIGIRNGTIYIGIHAPETGAAPIPLTAFVTGAKLFWENHTVFGHKVVMQVMDDQYNPSVARQVCETMSREDLFVMGAAGTDQIQACATDPVLEQTHTPYFSNGVTTNGLLGLPYYFAISQTYAAQSPEVFAMAARLYPADVRQKWAVVTENTPNFADAQASMDRVLASQHVAYCNIPTPKYFSESDAANAVTAARSCGAKVVYLDVDPNFWIDMVREATAQAYFPDWVGPGITNGENLVAGPVCGEQPNVHAAFLSPYPGLDRQPSDFSSENNPPPDTPAAERDLELAVYGASQVVYDAMLSVGSFANLTRDNLIAAMPRFSAVYGRQLTVYPTVNFAGGHFGGTGAWELELNCAQTQYDTVGMISQ
jgi:branched-chain amino acid transport system substrate-binding protein